MISPEVSRAAAAARSHAPPGHLTTVPAPWEPAASGRTRLWTGTAPGTCGCNTMASVSAFQAENAGSIPVTRSKHDARR